MLLLPQLQDDAHDAAILALLSVPPVKSDLVNCCNSAPEMLQPYLLPWLPVAAAVQ